MAEKAAAGPLPCGCPGSLPGSSEEPEPCASPSVSPAPSALKSALSNLACADPACARDGPLSPEGGLCGRGLHPFAFADFHRTFLAGENKVCLVGCPKLDDAQAYVEKLTRIITFNEIDSITAGKDGGSLRGMSRVLEAACEAAERNASMKIIHHRRRRRNSRTGRPSGSP